MWRGGKPQDDFEFESISDYLAEDDTLVWCDICEPDHETLKDLAQELGLNTWAVEDAIAESERTKAVDLPDAHVLHGVRGVARAPKPRRCSTSPHFGVRAAAWADHCAAVAGVRHRRRLAALRRARRPGVRRGRTGARPARRRRRRPLRGGAGARRRDRDARGRPVRGRRQRKQPAAQDLPAAQGSRAAAPGRAADARGRQLDPAPQARRQDRPRARPALRRPLRPRAAGRRSGRSRCAT